MYKLLLCVRYLRRRAIAYYAAAGVALCVFMMLVATCVMNGFLHKVEKAAKGLFGDIIVEANGQHGLAMYDELIKHISSLEEVEAASPFILSYGIVRVPGQEYYRHAVQIAGIRLPERVSVSDFEKGLFVQTGWEQPTFDPPREKMIEKVADQRRLIADISQREMGGRSYKDLPADKQNLINRLDNAYGLLEGAYKSLKQADQNARKLELLQKQLIEAEANGDSTAGLEADLRELEAKTIEPAPNRIILGLGIQGLSFRTDRGETVRVLGPGHKITLYVFPLGQRWSMTDMSPNIQRFTVVDDCSTDVSTFDSETVYVPFEALQQLNNMSATVAVDGTIVEPARCSMIHVKVSKDFASPGKLLLAKAAIDRAVQEFHDANPRASFNTIEVQTWLQRQARLVEQIASQRLLVIIMFLIISFVSVVLVFVIFYMVVVQKTRDIGVMKAVGASNSGVAAIFLAYGAVIGAIGAVVGAAGGIVFMHYINPIHDTLYDWLGFRVWSRESYWFEKIPNEVQPSVVVMVMIGAVIAGVIGALVPARRAARMEPVEALRYE
ncbi:MAG: ABC transporter permease [Planctomycetota bacterium]|jgi:lipoprotein-releasing system permease protein